MHQVPQPRKGSGASKKETVVEPQTGLGFNAMSPTGKATFWQADNSWSVATQGTDTRQNIPTSPTYIFNPKTGKQDYNPLKAVDFTPIIVHDYPKMKVKVTIDGKEQDRWAINVDKNGKITHQGATGTIRVVEGVDNGTGQKVVIPFKDVEGQFRNAHITLNEPKKTITYSVNGKQFNIPADKEASFLKQFPTAKKQ
jgi:hypothetical protein